MCVLGGGFFFYDLKKKKKIIFPVMLRISRTLVLVGALGVGVGTILGSEFCPIPGGSCGLWVLFDWECTGNVFSSCALSNTTVRLLEKDGKSWRVPVYVPVAFLRVLHS